MTIMKNWDEELRPNTISTRPLTTKTKFLAVFTKTHIFIRKHLLNSVVTKSPHSILTPLNFKIPTIIDVFSENLIV